MRVVLLAAALVLTALQPGGAGIPPDTPPVPSPPELVVFLLHGLGGGAHTFGDLPALLEDRYGDRLRVVPLTYSTGSRTLQVADFVREVQDQILATYHRPDDPLPSTTPFAFVMHSQGGIVGLRWVALCLYLRGSCPAVDGPDDRQTPTDLRLFVTYGTPFWGSPTATWIRRFPWLMRRLGGAQVRNLAVGGRSVASNRTAMLLPLAPSAHRSGTLFPPATEVVNVAGDVSALDRRPVRRLLKLVASFSDKVENDFVVDDTAARMDFYYHLEPDPGRRELGRAEPRRGRTRMSDAFYVLPRPHVRLFKTDGMVDFDRERGARHPSFVILRRHLDRLLGEPTAGDEPALRVAADLAASLQVFSAEVRVYPPRALQRPLDSSERSVTITNLSPRAIVRPRRRNVPILNQYHGVNQDDADRAQLRYQTFFHQGAFVPREAHAVPGAEAPKGRLGYRFEVPGFEPEELVLTVAPGFNSYARVFLEPRLPFPPLGRSMVAAKNGEATVPDGRYLQGYQRVLVGMTGASRRAGRDRLRAVVVTLADRSVEAPELAAAGWREALGSVAPTTLPEVSAWCWEGRVGEHVGLHRGALLARLTTPDDEAYGQLGAGRRVRVVGRFTADRVRGDPYYHAFDRYLVQLPGRRHRNPQPEVAPEMAWMRTVDLDLLRPCRSRR